MNTTGKCLEHSGRGWSLCGARRRRDIIYKSHCGNHTFLHDTRICPHRQKHLNLVFPSRHLCLYLLRAWHVFFIWRYYCFCWFLTQRFTFWHRAPPETFMILSDSSSQLLLHQFSGVLADNRRGPQWAAGGPSHLFLRCTPKRVWINSDQEADDTDKGHFLHDSAVVPLEERTGKHKATCSW